MEATRPEGGTIVEPVNAVYSPYSTPRGHPTLGDYLVPDQLQYSESGIRTGRILILLSWSLETQSADGRQ